MGTRLQPQTVKSKSPFTPDRCEGVLPQFAIKSSIKEKLYSDLITRAF